VKELGARMVPM
jgi:hypothetical protein